MQNIANLVEIVFSSVNRPMSHLTSCLNYVGVTHCVNPDTTILANHATLADRFCKAFDVTGTVHLFIALLENLPCLLHYQKVPMKCNATLCSQYIYLCCTNYCVANTLCSQSLLHRDLLLAERALQLSGHFCEHCVLFSYWRDRQEINSCSNALHSASGIDSSSSERQRPAFSLERKM